MKLVIEMSLEIFSSNFFPLNNCEFQEAAHSFVVVILIEILLKTVKGTRNTSTAFGFIQPRLWNTRNH